MMRFVHNHEVGLWRILIEHRYGDDLVTEPEQFGFGFDLLEEVAAHGDPGDSETLIREVVGYAQPHDALAASGGTLDEAGPATIFHILDG